MRGLRHALAIGMIAALSLSLPATAAAPTAATGSTSDSTAAQPTVDRSSALVQLKGDPLATSEKTQPAKGKKIDFNNSTTKSYRAQLSALRNDFKQWLQANAPKAQITGQWDISLNAVSVSLNGTSLATLRSAPQVVRADYEGLYHPTAEDPDLSLIHAIEAWGGPSGAPDAGKGVKVAIVDTGIDTGHPCFSDAGYPAQKQLGDTRFTNNKVIVAKVFYNKAKAQGLTPEAIQEHGTHVAGTVACDYGTPATVNGAVIPYGLSGVAPAALLGNYNVFPGQVDNARSEDILNALEAAYADDMDVVNMSLGGGTSGIKDLLTMAVDNLDVAGVVVAVAAGNSATGNAVPPHLQAPGHYTVESPGSAARALTAGASTVGHFVTAQIVAPSGSYNAATGDFATVAADTTLPLAVTSGSAAAGLGDACAALSADYSNKIVLVARGACSFSTKIRNVQSAGGAVAVVVNNVAGDPIAMGQDGTPNQPTIPAYMLSLEDGTAIKVDDGQDVTIPVAQAYVVTGKDDIMAGFSSEGPTDVDFRVKPDVVAPGVNVLSSIPRSFCDGDPCFAFFQGTSMATPHLAGSAAVVIGQHPDWSAAQVRSAIVNTADQGVLQKSSGSGLETDVNIIGAGRENLLSAVNASVALDPVSVSFGAIPSGSGNGATVAVTLSNVSGSSQTYSLAVSGGGSGATFGVSPASVTLAAGASATVDVSVQVAKGAAGGHHQGTISISTGGQEVAHAVVYVFVK